MATVIGHSEMSNLPTTVGIIGGKGDDEGTVIVFTGNDSVILSPRAALSLARKVAWRAIVEGCRLG